MTWVQSRDAEITRVLQEIDRHHQAWAGREQERAALRELYLKSMAPTGAAMYLLCWIMAHNHWRTFWLVGPFDGLAAADQWAKDYLEDDTCFPVEWSGDPADIRVHVTKSGGRVVVILDHGAVLQVLLDLGSEVFGQHIEYRQQPAHLDGRGDRESLFAPIFAPAPHRPVRQDDMGNQLALRGTEQPHRPAIHRPGPAERSAGRPGPLFGPNRRA